MMKIHSSNNAKNICAIMFAILISASLAYAVVTVRPITWEGDTAVLPTIEPIACHTPTGATPSTDTQGTSCNLRFTEILTMDNTLLGNPLNEKYTMTQLNGFQLKIGGIDPAKNLWLSAGKNCDKILKDVGAANFAEYGASKESTATAVGETGGTIARWIGTGLGESLRWTWEAIKDATTGFVTGIKGEAKNSQGTTIATVTSAESPKTIDKDDPIILKITEDGASYLMIRRNEENSIPTVTQQKVESSDLQNLSVAYWRIEKIDGKTIKQMNDEKPTTFYACQKNGESYKEAKLEITFDEEPPCTKIVECLARFDTKFFEELRKKK